MTVLALVGRCACGRPAQRLVETTPYCAGCLPRGAIRFADDQRIFRLLTGAGVARSTANAMMMAKLDFEIAQGLEFAP